jgi:hypothetical protein
VGEPLDVDMRRLRLKVDGIQFVTERENGLGVAIAKAGEETRENVPSASRVDGRPEADVDYRPQSDPIDPAVQCRVCASRTTTGGFDGWSALSGCRLRPGLLGTTKAPGTAPSAPRSAGTVARNRRAVLERFQQPGGVPRTRRVGCQYLGLGVRDVKELGGDHRAVLVGVANKGGNRGRCNDLHRLQPRPESGRLRGGDASTTPGRGIAPGSATDCRC